jgi:ATP-dependent DNA helicase DinG
MIRAALAEAATAADDRTLVLATSHADAEALAERVPGLALHRRGTRLDDHIKTYLATPGAALVTPSGWAGLDLPGRIQHLVITRIPFAPPDPVEQELLRRVLTAAGYDSGTIEGAILWRRTFDDAAKRLRQGLGRALRGPDDKAKIWIADPRFPLPDAIVRDRRAGVSQGAAKTLTGLTAAIPLRFRAGMRETWSDAAIFPHVAPPVEPC